MDRNDRDVVPHLIDGDRPEFHPGRPAPAREVVDPLPPAPDPDKPPYDEGRDGPMSPPAEDQDKPGL